MTPTGRVIVISSINLDVVVTANQIPKPGETVAGTSITYCNGGKGANQAVAAARAGAATVFVGAVGDDDGGRSALGDLDRAGVDTQFVQVLQGVKTGVAVVTVGGDAENTIVVIPGANGRLGADHVRAALSQLQLSADDYCILGFEVSEEVIVTAAEIFAAAAATVVINPSPVRELPQRLWAIGPILIANAAETQALAGITDVQAAAERLIRKTRSPLVVTLGGEGALSITEPGSVTAVPAAKVTPIDTTGAGDAFAGTYVAALATGCAPDEATTRAMAAAGLAVTTPGARSS